MSATPVYTEATPTVNPIIRQPVVIAGEAYPTFDAAGTYFIVSPDGSHHQFATPQRRWDWVMIVRAQKEA